MQTQQHLNLDRDQFLGWAVYKRWTLRPDQKDKKRSLFQTAMNQQLQVIYWV